MKHSFLLLFFAVIFCTSVNAQKVVVEVNGVYNGGAEGSLNEAIQTAITAGTLSNTIFRLKAYDQYVLSGAIVVPLGEVLEIDAPLPGATQEEAPPQILWTASSAPDKAYLIDSYGDLIMRNVWVRFADAAGVQVGTTILIRDNGAENPEPEIGIFENVIFDYSLAPSNGAGSVSVSAKQFRGTFRNCYWKNCTDPHYRYYGRALSFPYQDTEAHIDSVLFENCTFSNMGYVYMQEAPDYGDNVYFNHCTFHNVVMFTLESGFWYKMFVTNSIFVNTFMFGAIPVNDDEGFGGTINITQVDSFGFSVPFTDQDRRILFTNSSYFLEPWLVDWMSSNPHSVFLHQQRRDDEIPVPMPMMNGQTIAFFDSVDGEGNKVFPHMNKADLYDATDPGFIIAPTQRDSLKTFLYYKWRTEAGDTAWAWQPELSFNQTWPLLENLAYTNETLKTAGRGGFPLGDLYRWWPTEYAQWEAQKTAEYAQINLELEGETDVKELPGTVPSEYTLKQNYPNPFNPVTNIEYSIPKSGYVSLKIYNSIGEEIATLFEGNQKIGNYVATFNGSRLSSGVYFYKLETENISLTKKFILMK